MFRVILDASARRHKAYKIYLGVAAAKRWVLSCDYATSTSESNELVQQLRNIDAILHRVSFLSQMKSMLYLLLLTNCWFNRNLQTFRMCLLLVNFMNLIQKRGTGWMKIPLSPQFCSAFSRYCMNRTHRAFIHVLNRILQPYSLLTAP